MELFSANEIKPAGWLKKQLEIQAGSLSGNLDKMWRDVQKSSWIGGDAEGWERVPYWLDGFIPLAYLLDDADMKSRAKKYIDGIICAQCEDGWLCPCDTDKRKDYDLWALFLICKVLVVYYECTNDEQIPDVIEKALHNLYLLLRNKTVKLKDWGKFRWFECFISINFLYKRTKAPWLIPLAELLHSQGAHYEKLKWQWIVPQNKWHFETHTVNIAMALKEEVLTAGILNRPLKHKAERLLRILEKYNGTVVGTLTGDECLSGKSPVQGTELCSVVEQMFSYEILFQQTGDTGWADRLDMLAFNALPAACSADMWTHQYDQMVNQIECTKFNDKSVFRTNGNEAHIFGLEPHFGCCTANMGQGWPKYAQCAFMKNAGGIVSVTLAPSVLHAELDGIRVTVNLESNYPFSDVLKYTIAVSKPVEFDFAVRIPQWCKNVSVHNHTLIAENGFVHIRKVWRDSETVVLKLSRDIELVPRPNHMFSLKYGPLIFSLPIKGEWEKEEYIKDGVERKFPYCDYEIHRRSDWNYAFADKNFVLIEEEKHDTAFSENMPMLKIKAKMQKIDWGYKKGFTNVCAEIPKCLNAVGAVEDVFFQPYGTTTLRMTEMPFVD